MQRERLRKGCRKKEERMRKRKRKRERRGRGMRRCEKVFVRKVEERKCSSEK